MARTYRDLHEQVYNFEALYRAWERARQGKQYREEILRFSGRLGEHLLELQSELEGLTWQPGAYRERIIWEPKQRMIHIAPFRDRIVHQALCAVIAPLFEETFIYDSYACRSGKGSHAAVDRLTDFLRKQGSIYVLCGDLRKYFDALPHGLIMRELEWRITDGAVLTLLRRVLASYASDFVGPPGFGPRGVPIGNLTSQWFANIIGNCLDQHVKHELKCTKYLRYMDNFLLIGESKGQLRCWLAEISRLLAGTGLVLNPKTQIVRAADGAPFLGYRVWADHRQVLRANVVRGRRRMRRQFADMRRGELTGSQVVESLRSWFAHLRHADSYRLRLALWHEARPVLEEYLC